MPSPIAPTPFAVTFADGTTEKLSIKALSITQLYQWLYLAKDQSEPAMVALCTGKEIAWIDLLDVESFARLAGKCSEINFPEAVKLAKGAPGAAALVAPLMRQSLLSLRVMQALSIGSGALSDTQQASVSAPAT